MAWIFSLSAECGPKKEAADIVAAHFDGWVIARADASRFPCLTHTFQDGEAWWVMVCFNGISTSGIRHDQDEQEMTELSVGLYERLRSAPPFRFALVGIEVDSFRSFNELDNNVVELDFSGLVVSEAVWEHLGSPGIFVPFAAGYRWRPFTRLR
jgi:hypothetical protein